MNRKSKNDNLIRFSLVTLILLALLTPVLIGFVNKQDKNLQNPRTYQSKENSSQITQGTIRAPAVAGQFYPENKEELQKEISTYIENSQIISHNGKPRILVVPHAGLKYSGKVAASAFKQLIGKNYSRIIIIGSSHKKPIKHAAIFSYGSWQTPLGNTEIDSDYAGKIIEKNAGIIKDFSSHKEEHSLEMELIFLQSVLKDFKIVPILLGNISDQTSKILAYKLAYLMDNETLIVVSTDLSHYPNKENAQYSDQKVIEGILTGNKEEFANTIREIEKENIPNLDTCACGQEAIKVALHISELLNINDFQKIMYKTSGDISENTDEVVGYTSIGAFSELLSPLDPHEATKEELVQLSRETLNTYLETGRIPTADTSNPYLHLPIGAFTTLKKDGELRGCIGRFEPNQPLYKVIQETTVSAAIKDKRFQPVKKEELTDLTIELSLMTPKKQIDDWKEIELGKHGVVIENDGKSGTFLPQVADDTGWTKAKFLEELCQQKLKLDKNCYQDSTSKIYLYEAKIIRENNDLKSDPINPKEDI